MPFTKPITGTVGWDDEVNAVIDRASDLDTIGYYPLSAYGAHSASCIPEIAQGAGDLNSWTVRIWVPSNQAITKVVIPIWTAGVVGAGGLNACAVYSDTGTSLLAQSTSASSLWTSAGHRTATLNSTIAASAAGRFVRVVVNTEGLTTQPKCAFAVVVNNDTSGIVLNGPVRRSSFLSSYSGSFPSTIDPTTLGTPSSFMPLIMLG